MLFFYQIKVSSRYFLRFAFLIDEHLFITEKNQKYSEKLSVKIV